MPEPLRPTPAKTYTRENWIFIPTIASATLAPTVVEATALTSLDITNMAFADTAPNPEINTNLVEQNRRLGDAELYQFVGTTTYGGGQFTMAFDSQAAALADAVKAWEKFAAGGVTGFMARRLNVPKATDVIAGQFLHVYPAEFGPFMPTKSGEGEGAEEAMMGSWAITAPPKFKVAVLA
ncbi:MAG: hypothetical protein ACRDTJ_04360 [Pseudonocardiaceae bacterium]